MKRSTGTSTGNKSARSEKKLGPRARSSRWPHPTARNRARANSTACCACTVRRAVIKARMSTLPTKHSSGILVLATSALSGPGCAARCSPLFSLVAGTMWRFMSGVTRQPYLTIPAAASTSRSLKGASPCCVALAWRRRCVLSGHEQVHLPYSQLNHNTSDSHPQISTPISHCFLPPIRVSDLHCKHGPMIFLSHSSTCAH